VNKALLDYDELNLTDYGNEFDPSKWKLFERYAELAARAYNEEIFPFKSEIWAESNDKRYSIEHREEVEASLEDVLYLMSAIAVLINMLSMSWDGEEFRYSNLFAEISSHLDLHSL